MAITAAANGLDVVLEIAETPELNHRMIIFEMISGCDDIIRVSWRLRPDVEPEPVIEKAKPVINIAGREVYIPAGTFCSLRLKARRR